MISWPLAQAAPIFLPYLMGERSPHPDSFARGTFFGLSAIHDRSNMIQLSLRALSISQLDCVDVFRDMGVNINDMMACGGGGRSKVWRQMLDPICTAVRSTPFMRMKARRLALPSSPGVGAGV